MTDTPALPLDLLTEGPFLSHTPHTATHTAQLAGGFVGALHAYVVSTSRKESTEPPTSDDSIGDVMVAYKLLNDNEFGRAGSIKHGSAREALFYAGIANELRPALGFLIPAVYGARGVMESGDYEIALEFLAPDTAFLSVVAMGNQFKDMPAPGVAPAHDAYLADHNLGDLFSLVARAAAKLHAATWRDASLLKVPYLRGAPYYGDDEAEAGRVKWENVMADVARGWASAREPLDASGLYPRLIAAMDASLAASSWDRFRTAYAKLIDDGPFALGHGDFHGHNVFVRNDVGSGEWEVTLLDWAVVGPTHPMADLTQLVISDAPPALRREHEHAYVRAYWEALTAAGVDPAAFTFDDAWLAYRAGWGVGRWLWMIGVLGLFSLPDAIYGYFAAQVEAFLADHADVAPADNVYLIHCL